MTEDTKKTEYIIQFNLYDAEEGGVQTGHSNVTLIKREPSSEDDAKTFGVNSTSGGIKS